mgnify:FL=1
MKNKLRTVHVNGVEWKYVIDGREIRIYDPATKRIKARVPHTEFMSLGCDEHRWEESNLQPSAVKEYIQKNYEINHQK